VTPDLRGLLLDLARDAANEDERVPQPDRPDRAPRRRRP